MLESRDQGHLFKYKYKDYSKVKLYCLLRGAGGGGEVVLSLMGWLKGSFLALNI